MANKLTQNLVAILIPAHNEALVIKQTLLSVLQLVSAKDIFVVDDGSTDDTAKIAKKYTKNVLSLHPNVGKASATNTAITYFNLTKKYKYLFPIDADTKVTKDFLDKCLKFLESDTKEEYICAIGKVTGQYNNWLTAYRMWEYEVSQLIHKPAQEKEQAVVVCPGCATVYRSTLFDAIQIPTGTLTEDMDLTFLIHRKRLGKIKLILNAKVVTQDPYTLRDYVKQIKRWYRGYWQCLKKHHVPWGGQMLDLELMITTIEALAGGLIVMLLLSTIPYLLWKNPRFLVAPFLLDFGLFIFPTVFMTIFVHSSFKVVKYLPMFYLVRCVNSLVFLYTFFESILPIKLANWGHSRRYTLEGGKVCTVA
jgi:biofilm PGA synthesis N-glycosyltransferase PgaC